MSISNQMNALLDEIKNADEIIEEEKKHMLRAVELDDHCMLVNHRYMRDIEISFKIERLNMLSKLSQGISDELYNTN